MSVADDVEVVKMIADDPRNTIVVFTGLTWDGEQALVEVRDRIPFVGPVLGGELVTNHADAEEVCSFLVNEEGLNIRTYQ